MLHDSTLADERVTDACFHKSARYQPRPFDAPKGNNASGHG